MRKVQALQSAAGRDIGELPAVADPARKAAGAASLLTFCLTYFPLRFPKPFSPDHLRVIAQIEAAVISGGLFAMAMPRGSGKTTIAEVAVLWATMTGRRRFVVNVSASLSLAQNTMSAIKSEFERNDLLFADWPEVCYPLRRLDGYGQRCGGQLYKGKNTWPAWRQSEIVLPTIEGSTASGAIIKIVGITGAMRGMKFARPDGENARPDFVFLDDPQNDRSAKSAGQVRDRLRIINSAILKLAGPGKKLSAVCCCTVIRPGDLAQTLLDRDKSPEWKGRRCKLLYEFPTRMDLWQKYAVLRSEDLRGGGDGAPAGAFYAAHRAEMDAGAVVGWVDRFEEGDLSAVEFAMRLFFADAESFFSEFQNEPKEEDRSAEDLRPADLAGRYSGRDRGTVPIWASRLTAFVDIQGTLLYWLVAGWDAKTFTGSILDYGTFPDQPGRRYFTLADAQNTLATRFPGAGLEAAIFAGLQELSANLFSRVWIREDGAELPLSRLLIDANWGPSTDTVYEFARAHTFGGRVLPSHGRFFGAKSRPLREWQAKPGETKGDHWLLTTNAANKRAIFHLLVDTNHWKTWLADRLRQGIGAPGALSYFGSADKGPLHEMLIDQLTAERCFRVTEQGRTADEWRLPTDRPDNHWLDCLVGAAAAASLEGCALSGRQAVAPPTRKHWTADEIANKRRGSR